MTHAFPTRRASELSIGLRPEELNEQIAVPAVHCDAIEAQIIGGLCSLGESIDNVIDIARGHWFRLQRRHDADGAGIARWPDLVRAQRIEWLEIGRAHV